MGKKDDHVRIENTSSGAYRMFCERCGRDTLIMPPVSLDMALVMMKQFGKEHRLCEPMEEQTEGRPLPERGVNVCSREGY